MVYKSSVLEMSSKIVGAFDGRSTPVDGAGAAWPVMALSKVDFPAPLRPTRDPMYNKNESW
jgi:hypothetical protein